MSHSEEFQVSFQGEAKIQTVFFNDETRNKRNADTITSFLDKIGLPIEPPNDPKRSEKRRIWKAVDGHAVADLIGNLQFPEEAHDVNANRLRSYVRAQLAAGELSDWTIALLAGESESLAVNGWQFKTIGRNLFLVEKILVAMS